MELAYDYVVNEVLTTDNAIKAAEILVEELLPPNGLVLTLAKVVGGDESFVINKAIDAVPSTLVESPFGPAALLFENSSTSADEVISGRLTVYCVRCSVQGDIHISGRVAWHSTLEVANVMIDGNLNLGIGLGIDAEIQAQQTFTQPLVQYPIPPGFSVPSLITIGPSLELDTETTLEVAIQGQVLTGVNVSIADFTANLDLVNGSKSFSRGFDPKPKAYVEARAKVAAHAAFGLPFSLVVGIEVPPLGKFKKRASLTNRPSIVGDLSYTAGMLSTSVESNNACVDALAYNLKCMKSIFEVNARKLTDVNGKVVNDIYFQFNETKRELFSTSIPITEGCAR